MGKVHGSLARAGKVKSQTPKVWLDPPQTDYISIKIPLLSKEYTASPIRLPSTVSSFRENYQLEQLYKVMEANPSFHHTGRAPREEEDPQGPRQEAHHIHPPLRKRDHDRWKAKGQ